jgi:hypothetical protein
MATWITLRFGGTNAGFDAATLVTHMRNHSLQYIITGQNHCALSDHPKPKSLDVWLRRNFTTNHDTAQAVDKVISQLVTTGLFEQGKFRCPTSGRLCKGIRLVGSGRNVR